jgi:hypothetical protein
MSLGDKTLKELTELRVELKKQIARNPEHSGMERVELEDVEGWIELRAREADGRRTVPTFDEVDT